MPSSIYHATLNAMVAASGDPVNAPIIGNGKVSKMAIKRRLHVWENPHLHPESAKATGSYKPIHVVFDHHEFDWWNISNGTLQIGYTVESRYDEGRGVMREHLPFYAVASGMYAKVWLEQYDDEPAPRHEMPEEEVETPLFNGEEGPIFDLGIAAPDTSGIILKPQNVNLCVCMERYTGTDEHGNCTVCGNPAKPASETGATNPIEARELLKKKMAGKTDEEDQSARDRFAGQPPLLGLSDEPDNTATSLMLPLPSRDNMPLVSQLPTGQIIKITPPQLDETRLDLLKPIDRDPKPTDRNTKESTK